MLNNRSEPSLFQTRIIELVEEEITKQAKSQQVKPEDLNKLVIQWSKIYQIGAIKIKDICKNLVHLHLNGTFIQSKGCKIISQADWKELVTLELYQNEVDLFGISHLSKSQWTKLEKLHLGTNKIQSDGIKKLSKANWPCLKQLYIYENYYTHEAGYFYCYCQWPELYDFHTERSSWNNKMRRKMKIILFEKFKNLKTYYS